MSRHIRELDLLVAWQGTIESSWKSKAKGQTNCNPKIVLMVFYTGGEHRLESAGVLVLFYMASRSQVLLRVLRAMPRWFRGVVSGKRT